MKTDFLIIGSGIAGLSYALKVAQHLPGSTITIITKADESESNTKYAQGGMAVALDKKYDSFNQHIEDTLKAGDGLCNKKTVKFVVEEGPERLRELVSWGAKFDRQKKGTYHLGMEGGHTANRIIHHGDSTGLEIEKALLRRIYKMPNIRLLSHHYAIDIITQHHIKKKDSRKIIPQPFYLKDRKPAQYTCYGAYILNLKNNNIEKIPAKITLIATGGIGQIYRSTTNPLIATGDGIAMAYRAGAKVENMEFIQFHPTALYHPAESPSFLISEAVRGHGAILRTRYGKQFMGKYDTRKELASRDIVARAIDTELKASGDNFVYLDCRHIDINDFIKYFPNIYEKCRKTGIDISKNMIPVVPAAHYLCGGIKVDSNGNTTINNLYACGECAYTGLHGANRLASNSLLEALVFSHRCYADAVKKIKTISICRTIPGWNAKGTVRPKEQIVITQSRKELQEVMSNYVGIVRSKERLERAMKRLKILKREVRQLYTASTLSPQLCELRNMVDAAYLIVHQSVKRKKNKGVFYNLDLA